MVTAAGTLRQIYSSMTASRWPTYYRLPGDKTPSRAHLPAIKGVARSSIVHALTFHALPFQVDRVIDGLPATEQLDSLPELGKQYLSFSVYALKQMVAAGAISANTAWNIFSHDLVRASLVDEGNYSETRRDFLREAFNLSVRGDGLADISDNGLLLFEFLARAGQAGLAQFNKFSDWSQQLVFDEETCRDLSEPVRDEYRKALWLEMRLIERQIGLPAFNADLEKFSLGSPGGLYKDNSITGSVDIFKVYDLNYNAEAGLPVDSIIKAEIGHWMFGRLGLKEFDFPGGFPGRLISELMHRMHHAAYTPRIARLMETLPQDQLPPEALTFLSGQFLSEIMTPPSVWQDFFPVYPISFPAKLADFFSQMRTHPDRGNILGVVEIGAEYLDSIIRFRLVRALRQGEINCRQLYPLYRRLGVYVAMLHLGGKLDIEIVDRIGDLDQADISRYFALARARTFI
ncbi:MAG: hypothetical protein JW782_02690 [Candidatus Saganbacteria bacterium]|nr:hypothetical protein [Candidatus Saganbacteria bacterium]